LTSHGDWTRSRATGVVLVLALLALWEASARLGWVHSSNWPPFSTVLVATGQGLASGSLTTPLMGTLGRMLAGTALGCVLGVMLGLLLGTSAVALRVLGPVVEVLRPLPVPAIVPPLILFLGLGDALKVFAVAFGTVFPMLVNTMGGVRDVPDTLLQTARIFGTSRLGTLGKVILPAALPAIVTGLRISLGLGLVSTIVAEMVAGSGGLGFQILQTQFAMRSADMYAAVLCLAVTGYAMNAGLARVETMVLAQRGR
jgi:ABC-type nitrate/sulfonate/bicarbonate transport system permease component